MYMYVVVYVCVCVYIGYSQRRDLIVRILAVPYDLCICIYRVFPETQSPRGPYPQLNRDLIVRILAVLYDLYICMYMYVYVYVYISGIPRDPEVFPETQRPQATIKS